LSPDGSLVGFPCRERTGDALLMFDAGTGSLLWKRTGVMESRFLPGGEVIGYSPWVLTLLDPRTGGEIDGLPNDVQVPPMAGKAPWPTATPDGRHFHLRGIQTRNRTPFFGEKWLDKWLPQLFGEGRQTDVIVETATGRELFRLLGRGKRGVWLSDDGSTLVTADGESQEDYILRVWDVRPRRAYAWTIGVAAGAWLAGWALRRLWTRARSSGRPSPSGIPLGTPRRRF